MYCFLRSSYKMISSFSLYSQFVFVQHFCFLLIIKLTPSK